MRTENDRNKIADELSRMQIDQLHNATLNFSNNSLETKKLCVTAEIAVITILTGMYKGGTIDNFISIMRISILLIALLFYIVDIFLYYYQDKLRISMIEEENKIRERNGIDKRTYRENTAFMIICGKTIIDKRMVRSIFNGSQIMYWVLAILSIVIPMIPIPFLK